MDKRGHDQPLLFHRNKAEGRGVGKARAHQFDSTLGSLPSTYDIGPHLRAIDNENDGDDMNIYGPQVALICVATPCLVTLLSTTSSSYRSTLLDLLDSDSSRCDALVRLRALVGDLRPRTRALGNYH